MNRSGSGLKAYLGEFGHEVDDCVVVLDDADVPLGKARIRLAGGDAGHRGMRSILEALDTDRVCRVRIGVRGLGEDREAGRFVLSRVDAGGTQDLASGLATAERLLRKWIAERRQRDAAAADPVQSPNSP
jgi:peptidyl-tRNA hydrolase